MTTIAPPATPVRLTSFALPRSHALFTSRSRGFGWSRCAQHHTCVFGGRWSARERSGRQTRSKAARRYDEAWAWLPRACYGLLERATRGRGHCREVIGGSAMPHHATPNHFFSRTLPRAAHEPHSAFHMIRSALPCTIDGGTPLRPNLRSVVCSAGDQNRGELYALPPRGEVADPRRGRDLDCRQLRSAAGKLDGKRALRT